MGEREEGLGRISFRWPIDLALTVASHGWVQLAPWSWDPERGRLARTERLGGAVGTVAVEQRDETGLDIAWTGFRIADEPEILRRVGRWMSADWDPAPAIAALEAPMPGEAALIARGGGRILRCSTFYEDFVKTVLTINTSWSATLRMTSALVAEPGGGAFPTPQMLLDYGEARLREAAKTGFRASTLIAATQQMLQDGAIDSDGNGIEDCLGHDYLVGLKGIGPYAAAHCRLLLQDFSRIPVDSVVVAHLRERHGTDPASFIESRADCRDFLALGYRLMRLSEKLARATE